ncbi:MAG: enoyl-CoA hydratase/isomerase family protein [Alcaligenaceae bacterium]|nr:enoyl-CoA hydratase/isomerase family protein [Alcaligenaceae bacterium]
MHSYSDILLEEHGPIATITLNRPDAFNAISEQMIEELHQAVQYLDRQAHIKVILVKANGKNFCAGFDLKIFRDKSPQGTARVVEAGQRAFKALSEARAVTVAAINGYCVGGGIVLASACDLRYAEEEAIFWLPETLLGAPLALGGMTNLVREVGAARAMEFTLLCERWTAESMGHVGFLNKIINKDELASYALEVAETLSKRSSLSLEITKQQILAAKQSMQPVNYNFADHHLFMAALVDEESARLHHDYLSKKQ